MFLESDHSFEMNQMNDKELWGMYLKGCQKSLGGIFLRYHTRMYKYGMSIIQNEDEVKDGIQELFLKLWNNKKTINEATSVELYLFFSLRRILFTQKKQGELNRIREQKYMQIMPHSLQSTEEMIIRKERDNNRHDHFCKAMKNLTDRQREIIHLRLQNGMTNEEISVILNISLQRVKNCIYESTQKMKEHVYSWPVKDIFFE